MLQLPESAAAGTLLPEFGVGVCRTTVFDSVFALVAISIMALVSPTTRYTVQAGDQQFGPHTRAEIASMFKAGMVDGTAHVWCEGWPDWKPIAAILPSVLAQIAAKGSASGHVEPAGEVVALAAVVQQPPAEPQAVIEPVAAPQVVHEYAAPASAAPQQAGDRRKPVGYIARVGLRSFIFQIALAVWTLSYGGWLISVAASATSHASSGSSMRPTSPMAANPFDLSAGIFSSWICVAGGWCVIGLPLGIAAVATLNEPGR